MFYKDNVKSISPPIMTWIIIAANVIIFILMILFISDLEQFFLKYALTPGTFQFGSIYVLFTSMFLHGGIVHLLGNCLYLYVFGDNIEDNLGKFNFLIFYLICGVFAGAMHLFTHFNSMTPVIGASGAISGLLGAYFRLFPDTKVYGFILIIFYPLKYTLPSKVALLLWIILQLFYAFTGFAFGVAVIAHIAGFFAGYFGIIFLVDRDSRKVIFDGGEFDWMN